MHSCSPWDQFGVQCFAQGHFNMWAGGAGEWTANLAVNGSTSWATTAVHYIFLIVRKINNLAKGVATATDWVLSEQCKFGMAWPEPWGDWISRPWSPDLSTWFAGLHLRFNTKLSVAQGRTSKTALTSRPPATKVWHTWYQPICTSLCHLLKSTTAAIWCCYTEVKLNC